MQTNRLKSRLNKMINYKKNGTIRVSRVLLITSEKKIKLFTLGMTLAIKKEYMLKCSTVYSSTIFVFLSLSSLFKRRITRNISDIIKCMCVYIH